MVQGYLMAALRPGLGQIHADSTGTGEEREVFKKRGKGLEKTGRGGEGRRGEEQGARRNRGGIAYVPLTYFPWRE